MRSENYVQPSAREKTQRYRQKLEKQIARIKADQAKPQNHGTPQHPIGSVEHPPRNRLRLY